MSITALQLPGSLTVTQTALPDVGNTLDTSVNMLVHETLRDAATDSGTFTYYIDVPVDLNALITYTPSANGNDVDDAYAFAGFTVSNDASANVLLPEASAINVDAGLIDANNVPRGILAGTFPVTLMIDVSSNGLMTGSITISGLNVSSDVVDSNLKAQVAYWNLGIAPPIPSATDSDVLEATLAASQLNNHFSAELATILAYYNNVQLLESWTVSFSAIESSTNNSLAQHARQIENNGTSNVFAAGAKVMAMTPFSYSVAIVDYLGNTTPVIAASNVYGVATQV